MLRVIRTTCQLSTTAIIITKTINNLKMWTNQSTKDPPRIPTTSIIVQWVESLVATTTTIYQIINKIDKESKVASVLQVVVDSHPIMRLNSQMYLISKHLMLWSPGLRMLILEVVILAIWTKSIQELAVLTKIMRQVFQNMVRITAQQAELPLTICSLCLNMAQVVVSVVVSVVVLAP